MEGFSDVTRLLFDTRLFHSSLNPNDLCFMTDKTKRRAAVRLKSKKGLGFQYSHSRASFNKHCLLHEELMLLNKVWMQLALKDASCGVQYEQITMQC